MVNLNVKDSGAWKTVKKFHIKDAGTWKEVKKGHIKEGGSWKQFYPPGSALTSVVIPTTKSGFGSEGGGPHESPVHISGSTNLSTTSITGGVGPYSYSWFRSGPNGQITASGTNTSPATFSYSDWVDYADTNVSSEKWKVTVTDAYGRNATSNECTITIYLEHVCFSVDTPITLADGSIKQAGDVEVGDELKSYDTPTLIDQDDPKWMEWADTTLSNGAVTSSIVTDVINRTSNHYYELNGEVKVTGGHPFMVCRDGLWQWIAVKELIVGDQLFAEDGNEISITSIVFHDEVLEVISIGVEDVDTYFAGSFGGKSVLVHNK